jgi:3-phenylpropionate/trans-cinnamate dioxygenase ferredoxin reductase subunit
MSEPCCIVVGASHAGGQLAVSLRQEGWEGRVLVIGDEPYLPYNRPPLSKTFLSGEKHVDDLLIRPETQYEKIGVEFLLGQRVTGLDRESRTLTLSHGETFSWSKLALATGARVRKLDLPGADLKGVLYLRDISDVETIRQFLGDGKKAVIVGGGYIGLETAAMLRKLNMEVSVLEAAERVLSRVTAPELSHFYTRIHEEEGCRIHCGVQVIGFGGEGRVSEVHCADGSTFAADLVIIGIGVMPNTSLAETAGLEVDNGIVVNDACLTSDDNIAAAGDCTRHFNHFYQRQLRLESVQNAMEQAKVAAAALCGRSIQYNALPWFWSDQYDLKLQIAGLSEGYDQVVLRGDPDSSRKFAAFYLKGSKVIAVDAINSPQEFMTGKQLISRELEVDPVRIQDAELPVKSLLD